MQPDRAAGRRKNGRTPPPALVPCELSYSRQRPAGIIAAADQEGTAMPVHDWTRVDAGTFHAFHTRWISEIMGALNAGLLPKGYYALAEPVATRMQTDVLTLRAPVPDPSRPSTNGGVAVAEAPPQAAPPGPPDATWSS